MKTAHYIIFFIFKLLDKKKKGEKGKFFGKFGKEKSVLDMSKMKNGQGKTSKNLPFAPKCFEKNVGQKIFVTDFFGHVALDNDNSMITNSTFCRFIILIKNIMIVYSVKYI
jgi:hypothetical protein